MSRYQGWENRATWAMNLWLANDEGLYRTIQELARLADDVYELESTIKEFVEREIIEPEQERMGATLQSDLLNIAVQQVHWGEIARAWVQK